MKYNEDNFNTNLPAGYDGHFEWDCFKESGCWGNTRIEPMDFDGVVERNHNYLIFETKDEGKDIHVGQQITLDHLRNAKTFTVMKLWPKKPPFVKLEIVHHTGKIETITNHTTILEKIKAWYFWANKTTPEFKFICTFCGLPSKTEGECEYCRVGNQAFADIASGKLNI